MKGKVLSYHERTKNNPRPILQKSIEQLPLKSLKNSKSNAKSSQTYPTNHFLQIEQLPQKNP